MPVPSGYIKTYDQSFDAAGLSLADLIDTADPTALPDNEASNRATARANGTPVPAVPPFFPSFLTFRVNNLPANSDVCFKTHDLDTGDGAITPRSQGIAMHELSGSQTMLLRAYDLADFPSLDTADYGNLDHIGGMLSSERTFSQRRGYWEARLRMNQMGAGHHFSLWLLPIRPRFDPNDSIPEIDMVEIVDSNLSAPNGGLNLWAFNNHGNGAIPLPADDGGQVFRFLADGDNDPDFEGEFFDDWHVFGFLWDENQLVWTVDGVTVKQSQNWATDDFELYWLLTWESRVVSGDFPNAANGTTPWPAEIEVDYLRVYKENTGADMADIPITALTEVGSLANGDDLIVETSAGTRRVSRSNAMPRRGDLVTLDEPNINLPNDRLLLFDATDGLMKDIAFFAAIFGNFGSVGLTDDFTLDPAIHNGRPIEMRGTFTTGTITIDGNAANIGGATFYMTNVTPNDLTLVTVNGVQLYVDGAAAASATIRENTSCTVQMTQAGSEAIFSGG